MKPIKKTETKIFIIILYLIIQQQPPKKAKFNQHLLKAISFTIITLISWLNPEAVIAIYLVKLLFIILDWLNQKDKS